MAYSKNPEALRRALEIQAQDPDTPGEQAEAIQSAISTIDQDPPQYVRDQIAKYSQANGHPTDESVRASQRAALEGGQTQGNPFDRGVEVAASRVAGNAQLVLNPYVDSNRPLLDKIREQKDSVEQLLGKTTDPEQQRELQRVLSVTEDRLQGRTSNPDELVADVFSPEAENVARWATRNNVSRSRAQRAMQQLRASQTARTGISKYMTQKAKQAQVQQQQLEMAKQANPEMASLMYIDPETNAPTVDKNAMDVKVKMQNMQIEQQKTMQEMQAARLKAADEAYERDKERMAKALGTEGGIPSPLDIERMNKESVAAGGKPQDPQQLIQEANQKIQLQMRMNNILGRQAYQSFLTPEQLDKRFPLTGVDPSMFDALNDNAKQLLNITTRKAQKIEPIPEGMTMDEFARSRNVFPVHNIAQFNRMKAAGLIGDGDYVVTKRGLVPVSKVAPE